LGNQKRHTTPVESVVKRFSDRGSTPLASTITHTYEPITIVVYRNVFAIQLEKTERV